MFMLPFPKKHTRDEGDFFFSDKLVITLPKGMCDDVSVPYLCELVSGYTAEKTKASFVFSDKLSGVAVVSDSEFCQSLECSTDGDYELISTPENIKFVFSDKLGFIHAFVSFLQLIRIESAVGEIKMRVPCYKIWDKPDLSFRCVHLCVFHQTTLDFLKKSISLCGIMKCSHVVIEFWGMYRYECCPGLAWKEAYTKEQIRPIIEYANALGLEVIPMLNHLGHASQGRIVSGKHSALDNDLSLAPLFEEDGWSWCTSNPDTLKLLAECRKELIELCGKGSYFHIGCDEAYTFGSCDKCSKKSRNELFIEHLLNINEDLKKYGRRPIMWADMLLNRENFDKKYEIWGSDEYKIRPLIPRDIIMADWQYGAHEEFKTSIDLDSDGFDVLACPWQNPAAGVITAKNNSLFGVMGTTWHLLSELGWLIPFLCDKMWGEAQLTNQEYHLHCAYNIRRCVPAHGDYEKAGIIEKELNGKIV